MSIQTVVDSLHKEPSLLKTALETVTKEQLANTDANMMILKEVLSPFDTVPTENFALLRDAGYTFNLNIPIVDTVLANEKWDVLLAMLPEMLLFDEKTRKDQSDKMMSVLPEDDKDGLQKCKQIAEALIA